MVWIVTGLVAVSVNAVFEGIVARPSALSVTGFASADEVIVVLSSATKT